VETTTSEGGPASTPPPEGRLAAGITLGGRITISGLVRMVPYGEIYRAVDQQKNNRVCAVRLIRPDLVQARGVDRLRRAIEPATKLDQKNIVHVAGLAVDGPNTFLVTDLVDGMTLRQLMASRGRPFTMQGAYNVVAHLANALATCHPTFFHGGISPSTVLVSKAGRVRICDFGIARVLPTTSDPSDRACIAPEMSSNPDSRADIYSLGALLFELLTGRARGPHLKVATLAPGVPPEVDALIARCTVPVPSERYSDPLEVKAELAKILDSMSSSAVSGKPVRALDETTEKWIVSKKNVDFGPYNFTKIREMIAADEIEPGHILVDNETGDRQDVNENPILHPLLTHAAQAREDRRRANVEQAVVSADKKAGAALYLIIGGGAIALAVGAYFVIKLVQGGPKKKQTAEVALLEETDLKNLKVATVKHVEPKRRAPSSGGHQQAAPGFDDSQNFDLAGADENVGDERLDDDQINEVISANGQSLGRCLLSNGSHHADIEFIIAGSGKVTQVRVNGQTSGGLASCLRDRMMALQFPKFNGARTRAEFDMGL
jgi:hypothetical protein